VRGGRGVVVAEAEATDERSALACRATATFRVTPRKEE
jgi:acyl-coenzyme A thioesterase PaaI-like protein